jgi:hypothetical protein
MTLLWLVGCALFDPTPLDAAVARIVASEPPCAGSRARIDVWRTPSGEVHRLYYHGDLMDCSHPPSIYFDAAGVELESVANEPVTDATRAHYEALHARHQASATKAETLYPF